MYLTVHQSPALNGKVILPSSKSQTIRGLFIALLANGKSTLVNALDADDINDALQVLKAFNASLQSQDNTIAINSRGLPFHSRVTEIYTGNSGITTRFIMPLLGLRQQFTKPIIVRCGKQMQERPMQPLFQALGQLGMTIDYLEKEGQLPVVVYGQLEGGEAEIDGAASQYSSSLLLSLPCAQKDSIIKINNLHARPYLHMTLEWLNKQGIVYKHEQSFHQDVFFIQGRQSYRPIYSFVKGDFSSASCLFVAAALLGGEVHFYGLDKNDSQGDKTLLTLLTQMGAEIEMNSSYIRIQGGKPLSGLSIDVKDCPDLIPALAVLATQAQDKTTLYNGTQARYKETDRIHSMVQGLRKMGITIDEATDGMTIHPGKLHGALIEGYNDHRTVMAFAVAGLLGEGETHISSSQALDKTYPGFITSLQSLGASINYCPDLVLETASPQDPEAKAKGIGNVASPHQQ